MLIPGGPPRANPPTPAAAAVRATPCDRMHVLSPMARALRIAAWSACLIALAPPLFAQQGAPDTAGAYRDAGARLLVAQARARHETLDRSIRSYVTTMKERIGVGLRALRRDRMLYHRELALRITWRRDTVGSVEVVGARQGIPIALKGETLPEDLRSDAFDYAFDPSADRFYLGTDSGFVIHPLAVGSEQHYRFESGDSTLLTFPDGRRIRIFELRVIPRRADAHLIAGSLWIEGDGHGVVRMLARLARPFDFEIDIQRTARAADSTAADSVAADSLAPSDSARGRRAARDGESEDIPGFLKPLRADVRFFAVEYGLWDDHWWLPRLVSFDGVATVGRWAVVPVRYELTYESYDVTGDPAVVPEARPVAQPNDSAKAECEARFGDEVECRCRDGSCFAFTLTVPTDTAALLASPALPVGFRSTSDTMISEQEIADLAQQIQGLPGVPWQTFVRRPRWGLARYNRVEALSLGARGEIESGPLWLDGTVRLGVADVVPNVEVGVGRHGVAARTRLAGYYRLAAADTTTRPFGLVNSVNALFFGKDDGEYFRALGIELHGQPAVTQTQTYGWRLYVERQRPLDRETNFSLRNALNKEHLFRPNIVADSADELGATFVVRGTRPLGRGTASLGAEVLLEGATGTFDFVRTSLTVRANTPLPGPFTAGIEVAGGTSAGTLPVQSRWYLGGPYSLRGYDGGVAAGDEFWRARVEVANDFPAARLALFADAGRAGPRGTISTRDALLGVGAGASFLDGLARIDVARATRAPTGWRVDFYVDGVL